MAFDYTDAPEQRGTELIPADTVATVQLTIRPGGAGEGGLLKRSKHGGCEMIDAEFVVVDGPHAKRKLWENLIVSGSTDGHTKAAEISRGKLRAILRSHAGLSPTTGGGTQARTAELGDFNACASSPRSGSRRAAKGATAGESYPDRNTLQRSLRRTAGIGTRSSKYRARWPVAGILCCGPIRAGLGVMRKLRSAFRRPRPSKTYGSGGQPPPPSGCRKVVKVMASSARTPIGRLGHRVGLARRRHPVRMDLDARRAGNRREHRYRARHPYERPRPRAVGCRRGCDDPAGIGGDARYRLGEAGQRVAT